MSTPSTHFRPDRSSIRDILIEAARRDPERRLVAFENGEAWTRKQALDEAARAANFLREKGVRQGDSIILCADNGPGWLCTWWGCALLGVVIVPVNPSLKGQMLADTLETIGPRLAIVDRAFTDNWTGVSLEVIDLPSVSGGASSSVPDAQVAFSDPHAVFFTSGTTGRSKGSLCSNAYFWHMASWREAIPINETDVMLSDLPFYHTGAVSSMVYMLAKGGSFVVGKRPSLSEYWTTVSRHKITVAMLVGSMVNYLVEQPPSEDDRRHSIRTIFLAPLPKNVDEFARRFGIHKIFSMFGSTEMSSVLIYPPGVVLRPPSCGVNRPGVKIRLVDTNMNEVPVGTPGEMLVQPTEPTSMSLGYVNQPEATAIAWKDGWFHSGDRLYRDEDGYFYFFDRVKDSIRRRGENVSTYEVEREVASYPGIAEAACIGVPDDLGVDEELKVFVLLNPGVQIDLEEMTVYLAKRMPHYMVPRYVEIRAELPRTATGRVRKYLLREPSERSAVWDREAHGVVVSRTGVVHRKAPSGGTVPRNG